MQILVGVATIQPRTLKTEVEKGSMGTAVVHGLVGPNRPESSLNCAYVLPEKGEVDNIPLPY